MAKPDKAEAEAKKEEKPKSKLPLFAAIGIVVLGGGGFAVTQVMAGGDEEANAAAEPQEGEVKPLESMIVNLADKDAVRFARVGAALVFAAEADTAAAVAKLPLVRGAILRTFVPKSSHDLTSLEGLDRINTEITEAAKSVITDGTLMRVVITDLVVQ
jgi:flagellar FliL protein